MNKTIRTSLYFLIVIVILGLILYPKFKPEKTDAQVQQTSSLRTAVLPVEAKVAAPTRIENIIKITGAILANESVALRSEISGKVERIYFKEGQRVKRGDVMLTINDDEMVAQVERLKFTKQLNEEIEYRQRQLLDREAISKEEYDIALTTLKTTLSDIKEREAGLAKHKIIAPFDGIVGLRQVSEGSYISPSDLVANMYSINPIKIEFSVPGKYTQKVKKDDKITFTVESSDQVYTGTIYAIEPMIDSRTRTLLIRAICNNEQEDLIPGQFANINYILEVLPDALLVPSEAVIPELNSHKVFVLKNGKANPENVSIGLRTEKDVQITKGINPGDTVITTGILQVRQGMPVDVTIVN
jgi:membrane fusion protein, multidrug efflux system